MRNSFGMMTTAFALLVALCFCADASAQALWKRAPGASRSDWYKEDKPKLRMWKKHDLVMVVIEHDVTATRNDQLSSKKEFQMDTTIADYVRIGKGFDLTPSTTEELKNDVEANLENDAQGSRRRRSTFSDVVMAEVTEVMPGYDPETNRGQLMIRAYKQVQVGGDIERIELTGRIEVAHVNVRPGQMQDSISADRVFGATITYVGDGDVSNSASQGWFGKFLGWVWPF